MVLNIYVYRFKFLFYFFLLLSLRSSAGYPTSVLHSDFLFDGHLKLSAYTPAQDFCILGYIGELFGILKL